MVRRLPAKQFSVGSIPTSVSTLFTREIRGVEYQLSMTLHDNRAGLPLRRHVEVDEAVAR